MKVVLPIAAILAILIAAGARVPPSEKLPVDLQGAPAHAAEPYPVAFDPFTGWGVADLYDAALPGPVRLHLAPAQGTLPSPVEADPLDRYAAESPFPHQPERTTGNLGEGSLVTLVTFADVRALYEDAPPAFGARAVPPAAPAAGAWWDSVPLDAK